jgi:hypothetical protein
LCFHSSYPTTSFRFNQRCPSDTFTVTFNIAKFEPLIEADIRTVFDPDEDDYVIDNGDGIATDGDWGSTTPIPGPGLTFAGYTVKLWPRYTTDLVSPVEFTLDDPTKVLPVLDGANLISATLPNITDTSTLSFVSGRLPKHNVDMLLQFEAEYYAYGDPETEGFRWVIRNGLYGGSGDTVGVGENDGSGAGSGSDILVRFGSGTPAGSRTDGIQVYW